LLLLLDYLGYCNLWYKTTKPVENFNVYDLFEEWGKWGSDSVQLEVDSWNTLLTARMNLAKFTA
jgi:hypothetical protein